MTDCKFPIDIDATVDSKGNTIPSCRSFLSLLRIQTFSKDFLAWDFKHRFSRDVISKVTEKLCSAAPVKYSDILELDRRIREFEDAPIAVFDDSRCMGQQDLLRHVAMSLYKHIGERRSACT